MDLSVYIKEYYLDNYYNNEDLDLFVLVGWISDEQKKEWITTKNNTKTA